MLDDLRGKAVLVTGASTGIGAAVALGFGRCGAKVAVHYNRSEVEAEAVAGAVRAAGAEAIVVQGDVTQKADVQRIIDQTVAAFGRLDVLVNNAGGQFAAPAMDITPKGWNAVIDTNLTGSWYMMQAAARQWRDHGQPGCIINMVAVLGMCSGAGIPHTVAARAGEIHLSKALSVEWAPHDIRVNCIAVGVIASPGLAHYPETAKPSFDHNPMRRLGSVHDIAEACVYLAASSGRFINGTVLTIDGGADVWGEYWPLGRPDYFKVDD
jgi:citronellol/citronellal dehydrogenase